MVSTEALNAVVGLPTRIELDYKPTLEEVEKELDALSPGIAPGGDGIPPEVLKCAKETLTKELHDLLACAFCAPGHEKTM